MKTLLIRSASGVIYALLIIFAVLLGKWTLAGLTLLFMILGSVELKSLLEKTRLKIKIFPFVIAGIVFFSGCILYINLLISSPVLIALTIVALLLSLMSAVSKDVKIGIQFFAGLFLLSYLAIPLILINSFEVILPAELNTEYFLLGFFFLTWIYDTFAYFSGSLLGKHKLAPAISPGKTYEGAIGGLVFTLIAGWGLYELLGVFELYQWLVFAFILVVSSTIGDLFESAIKRTAGVKDSGNLIPGHGGILDRIDSMLLAAPFTFVYFYVIL